MLEMRAFHLVLTSFECLTQGWIPEMLPGCGERHFPGFTCQFLGSQVPIVFLFELIGQVTTCLL